MKRNEIANFPKLGKATINKYSREAQGNEDFLAAVGNGFSEDPNFMATGAAVSTQEPYRVVVTNAHATDTQTAIIFGQFRYGNATKFGSGPDITVSMGVTNVTYAQLLNQSSQEPFEIVLTRIKSANTIQLATSFLLKSSDASGTENSRPITVDSYDSPDQFKNNLIDVLQSYRIDGSTWLEYSMQPNSSVTISFFVAAKVNVAGTLNGNSPIKEFGSQRVRTFGTKN